MIRPFNAVSINQETLVKCAPDKNFLLAREIFLPASNFGAAFLKFLYLARGEAEEFIMGQNLAGIKHSKTYFIRAPIIAHCL